MDTLKKQVTQLIRIWCDSFNRKVPHHFPDHVSKAVRTLLALEMHGRNGKEADSIGRLRMELAAKEVIHQYLYDRKGQPLTENDNDLLSLVT